MSNAEEVMIQPDQITAGHIAALVTSNAALAAQIITNQVDVEANAKTAASVLQGQLLQGMGSLFRQPTQPLSPHQELQQCMHEQNDSSVWQPAPQSGVRCLDIVLWAHDGTGEVLLGGQLKAAPPSTMSYFKHQHALNAGDILKMHVNSVQLAASIGFAGQAYDPSRHADTCRSTSWVSLGNGNAYIMAALGKEGVFRSHVSQLHPYASRGALNDVSLRCDPKGNVPQIQFNEDGVWHDWIKDRAALKAGPWFPYLQMYGACLSNFRVETTEQILPPVLSPTALAGAKQVVPQAAAFTKEEEDEEEEEEKDALSHPN